MHLDFTCVIISVLLCYCVPTFRSLFILYFQVFWNFCCLHANLCVLILKLRMQYPPHSFPCTKLNVLKEVGSDTDTDASASLH